MRVMQHSQKGSAQLYIAGLSSSTTSRVNSQTREIHVSISADSTSSQALAKTVVGSIKKTHLPTQT